jgi:hypothetical protein
MKSLKSLLIALLVSSTTSWAQTTADFAVTSNQLMAVLGPADAHGLPTWNTNTAYVAGALVQGTNYGQNYMCLIGGTSTNSAAAGPTGLGRITDGTVTWVSMLASRRKQLLVQNTSSDSAAKVYVGDYIGSGTNLSRTAELLSGGHIFLSFMEDDVPQGKIYVWANRNATVSTWER